MPPPPSTPNQCVIDGFQRTSSDTYTAPGIQVCTAAQAAVNPITHAECAQYVRRVDGETAIIDVQDSTVTTCALDNNAGTTTYVIGRAASDCDAAQYTCYCPIPTNNLDLGDPGISYGLTPVTSHETTRYYITHYVIGADVAGVTRVESFDECCTHCTQQQPPPAPPSPAPPR